MKHICCLLTAAALILATQFACAGSAMWNLNPTSADWNTAANWTPATVPNGPADIATFDVSTTNQVTVANATVDSIVFNPGASAFTFTISGTSRLLSVSGGGITNNSGVTQNFATALGAVEFHNSATAGRGVLFTNPSRSTTSFFDTASAGEAAFVNTSETDVVSGKTAFFNSATAANASFTNTGSSVAGYLGGIVEFNDTSTAADATFMNEGGNYNGEGYIAFNDHSTAGSANFTVAPGASTGGSGGVVSFNDNSSAGDATFTILGTTSIGSGGDIGFQGNATAGNATFVVEGPAYPQASAGGVGLSYGANGDHATFMVYGGAVAGAYDSHLIVSNGASLGDSTVILYPGVRGSYGAYLMLGSDGIGGNARLEVYGNAFADMQNTLGMVPNSIGSIEGDGHIYLGKTQLSVGSNNLSTTFSGLIEDYGYYHEIGGSLIKIGRGTLALTHDNTFTGGVTVRRGVLLVNNATGSGTGPGPVQVEGGTLGGKGFISGLVTVGTGGSRQGVLAPGTDGIGVLTMQRTLTFGANGAYHWNVETESATGDEVAANGVAISSSALFNIFPRHNASIPIGSAFTVIDNRAATPIVGTFSNLADGSAITIGSNTFQANYEGGDGNDLTLTVIP